MKELLPVVICTMILAVAADLSSQKAVDQWDNVYYKSKNRLLFLLMGMILALFVGLRTDYNDTVNYVTAYNLMEANAPIGDGINWLKIGDNPGFVFLNQCMRRMGASAQSFLMIYALITVGIYIWFIRKYTEGIWLSIFFFFVMGGYTFCMAAIKQCVAVAFALIAVDRAIEKKYIQFVFWIIIAMTFHPYAFMFLIVPFLGFTPWTRRTYILLGATIIVALMLERFLGSLLSITSMMGETYDTASLTGEGVNLFRVAVCWAPIGLSYVTRAHIAQRDNRVNNMIINLSMVNAMIMFIAIFGTANYFARLANYFMLFQVLLIPILLNAFNRSSKVVVQGVIMLCYCAYFWYSTAIIYGGFDSLHRGISLLDYIRTFV